MISIRQSDKQKQKRLTLTLIKDNLNDIIGLDTRLSLTQMSVKDNTKNKNYVIIENDKVKTDLRGVKNIDQLELLIKYLEGVVKL